MKSVAVLAVSVTLACPVAAQTIDQKSQGACSPTIAEVAGSVSVNLTCNLTDEDLRLNARHNWELAKRDARVLLFSQASYLLPAVNDYVRQPTPAHWAEVRHEVALIHTILTAAIESALAYEATLPHESPQLQGIHSLYRSRGIALSALEVQTEPMPVPGVRQWLVDYSALVHSLTGELDRFDETTLSKTATR
ncbi:hypothetical protein SAMN05446935_9814 [Burkholderia sp. YR290]|nr:hypothetical protein SAMN05446935_9814 [Burkholderia sp. YR290]